MTYRFVKLTTWPGPRTAAINQRRSPFKSGYQNTIDKLSYELDRIGATAVVLQLDIDDYYLRNDGLLRVDARPRSSAVIVSFNSKHGPLSYPCDRYSDWQSNLRAVALSLEALRAVDRYGVTRRGEQYTGWAALPAPTPAMDAVTAAKLIGQYALMSAADIFRSRETLDSAWRAATKRCHPDSPGGSHEKFLQLQAAYDAVKAAQEAA